MLQQGDDPPVLVVGTEVSAKYKGAFCEAKVRKVVRSVKCKVVYKVGGGPNIVSDEQIEGDLRVGETVQVKIPDKEPVQATIAKIQDCSHYTVVFDDGDITTLRRSALCLKSGRHFNESETLDQLPLTHPEHFGNPVIGGRRGRSFNFRHQEESSDEEEDEDEQPVKPEREENIGKVVCVESTDTKKKSQKENWFPGLVVAPTAQDTVRIRIKDEYLVRSFKDGRYYTVPKKEATEFTRDQAKKQDSHAVQAALEYLDRDTLPPHWDRDVLFGLSVSYSECEVDLESDSSDDEPREEKDHFVAQLYKYMDDRGTPLNKGPQISNRDIDLYRLFRAAQKLGGYNRVTSQNQWKAIAVRLGFSPATNSITNLVKQAYKKFLQPFEDFNRKLGCTMVAHPRANRIKGRSLVRASSVASPKPSESSKDLKSASSSAAATEEYDNTSESSAELAGRGKKPRKLSLTGLAPRALKGREEPEDNEDNKPILAQARAKPGPKPKDKEPKEKEDVPTTPPPAIPKRQPVTAIRPEASIPDCSPSTPSTSGRAGKSRLSESGTLTLAAAGPVKGRKKKEATTEVAEKIPERPAEEEKKKEKKDSESSTGGGANGSNPGVAVTPGVVVDDFSVDIGDKLKVFYHEKKVTYEAKVLEISADNLYLVHYTGWNTRYDEWVPKTRIAENLTSKQKRLKAGGMKAGQANTPSAIHSKVVGMGFSKRGRGGSRSDSLPPRSTTPCSVTSNSSRTKSPGTPAQRRTTRGQPNALRRTSNNTDISSMHTDDSDTDSDEPVKKPTRSSSTALPPGRLVLDAMRKDSKDASSSYPEDEATKDFMEFLDIDQMRSEMKEDLKSPSPDAEQSPTSSVHLDHKISLFHLSDSNTDSNELKASKESGSSSDTQSFDEDSQGYVKKAAAKAKKDDRSMGPVKETEKSLSKILGTDSSEKEVKVEVKIEDIGKFSASSTKGLKVGAVGRKTTGEKVCAIKQEKGSRACAPSDGKAIKKGLVTESPLDGKKKEDPSDNDVYEFKEPEPFEFEASTTNSRKTLNVTPTSSMPSSSIDENIRGKKRILDAQTLSPSAPTGKKPKRSPAKGVATTQATPQVASCDEHKVVPSDPFDVLRKSPNFNIGPNHSGTSSDSLPEFTEKLPSTEGFSNPILSSGSKLVALPAGGPIGPLSISGLGLHLALSPTKSSSSQGSISSAFVNTRDDDDQWQSLRMFKNAVEGQIDMDMDTLTKPKSVQEGSSKGLDFEAKSEVRSSIADKFLKTFRQVTGSSSNSSSPSSSAGEGPSAADPETKSGLLFGRDFAEKLEPKITKKEHLKLDLPEMVIPSVSMAGSPDKLDSVLELKPPKNNDLSETIEKLKSAINDEDSSVSTDSERERLVIEDDDRSQSSDGPTANPVPNDENKNNTGAVKQVSLEYSESTNKRSLTPTEGGAKVKEELTISSVTVKEQSMSFASKFQESFYGSLGQTSVLEIDFKTENTDTDLTCKESIDDDACEAEKKDVTISLVATSTAAPLPGTIRPPNNIIAGLVGSGHLVEKDVDSLPLLLCEETIPTSPCRPLSEKCQEDRKSTLESRLLEGVKSLGQTPSSSPRDSQSPDDSKSDSEDLKKTESDNPLSSKKRRRCGGADRRSPELDCTTGQKRRKLLAGNMRKGVSSNNAGSDSEDNSDPLSTRQPIMLRSPKPCQFNFLVQLDPSLSSHQKIAILEKKIQDLRKAYNMIKSDLVSIDRRRKKLRRRERESKKNQQQKIAVVN